jgi:hypothetical protein
MPISSCGLDNEPLEGADCGRQEHFPFLILTTTSGGDDRFGRYASS